MRKQQKRRSLSSDVVNAQTYDIVLLKGGDGDPGDGADSGDLTIAAGISKTEADHFKKILARNQIPFKISRRNKRLQSKKRPRRLVRGNIALYESLKGDGEYKISQIDYFCLIVLAVVLFLLGANSINAVKRAPTELHRAVERRDGPKIRRILESRPELLSLRDGQGRIPLHYVGEDCRIEIPAMLLDCGSPVNVLDNYGRTPADYVDEGWDRLLFYLMVKNGALTTR